MDCTEPVVEVGDELSVTWEDSSIVDGTVSKVKERSSEKHGSRFLYTIECSDGAKRKTRLLHLTWSKLDRPGKKKRSRLSSESESLEFDSESLDAVKKRHGLFKPSPAPTGLNQVELTAGNSERAREELMCSICHELLFEPVLLTTCGHSFCRPCLAAALDTEAGHDHQGGLVRRCTTCRSPLCGCSMDMKVNYVLWNLIQVLFPNEVSARHEEERQKRRGHPRGEMGGAHGRGYECLVACGNGDSWEKLGRRGLGCLGTRSVVVDEADQTRQLALSLALYFAPRAVSASAPRRRRVCVGDAVIVDVYLLNMEEDEVADQGFPLLFRADGARLSRAEDECGDEVFVSTEQSDSTLVASVRGARLSWGARRTFERGHCQLTLPLWEEPGEYVVELTDVTTQLRFRLKVPVAPEGWGGSEGDDGDSNNEDDDEDEDQDAFENDGFVVFSDADDHSEERESSDGDDKDEDDGGGANDDDADDDDADDDDADDEGVCDVCGESTAGHQTDPVLLCEGCDCESHLACAHCDEVPEGDWFCADCEAAQAPPPDPDSTTNDDDEGVCGEREEDKAAEFNEKPSPAPVRPRKRKVSKRVVDSDSD